MFLANNFVLSDAEDNTPGPPNRSGITDLPLFRTLLAIREKSEEPSFWEVSFLFHEHMQVWQLQELFCNGY